MSEEVEDPNVKRIREAIETLSEHFDSVHIFATLHEGDGTSTFQHGCGNWYARYGQVVEWIEKQQETTRCKARKDEE